MPGANRSSIVQAINAKLDDSNVIAFPALKPVHKHPVFGNQFKHCGGGCAY